jgi:hypothetical protein
MPESTPTFILLGKPQPSINLTELNPVESEITGKDLRQFRLEATFFGAELNDQLNEELQTSGESGSALLVDTDGGKWKIGNRSYSSNDRTDRYQHSITVTEVENLTLLEVSLHGMTFRPEQWKFDDRLLSVLVTADEERALTIERLIESGSADDGSLYFDVQQVGIRDEPISMRFGRCLWQPLEGGGRRYIINLVTKRGDDDSGTYLGFSQPEISRLKDAAISQRRKVDALVQELKLAGVLDDAAIGRIEAYARSEEFEDRREFDRCPDIDLYWKDGD